MSELFLLAAIPPLLIIVLATELWRLKDERKADIAHDWRDRCEGCEWCDGCTIKERMNDESDEHSCMV